MFMKRSNMFGLMYLKDNTLKSSFTFFSIHLFVWLFFSYLLNYLDLCGNRPDVVYIYGIEIDVRCVCPSLSRHTPHIYLYDLW